MYTVIAFIIISLMSFSTIGCWHFQGQDIRYKYITSDQMEVMFGQRYLGYAIWDDNPLNSTCDIYLLNNIEDYYNSEDCYEAVRAHELRHCAEGSWHGPNYTEPACHVSVDSAK